VKNKLKKLIPKKPKLLRKKKDVAERFNDAIKTLPKITDDTLAEHREDVLSSARKYIYPLQHSKNRIVLISSGLFAILVIVFFVYCGLALYKFQSNNSFLYGVTRVIPFPIAKVGPSYVSYENYLFQLRHYMHYYESQQQVNFSSVAGKEQLASYKKEAMQQIINDAYVKQLASKNHVNVSSQEVTTEIDLVRSEDRLGSNNKELAAVLNQFWGWSINDFQAELKQELLAQKVVSTLDTATQIRAQAALDALHSGVAFSAVASQYSDDTATKDNGGQFGFMITEDTTNIAPQTLQTLLSLKAGQVSGIIDLGNALEIDTAISNNNGQIQAAHILFNFQSINTYIQPLSKTEKPYIYINQKI
jgi:parvulin-like peptidyl-prolyl isomerase